ncbi:MAG: tetratricopeptide repeat protein, partial [Cyanobacteria bacterium]|nr:tetratricopeptide repeat protein [Cyanobacteriota bacterium]
LYKLDAAEENAKKVIVSNPRDAQGHLALGVVLRNRTASQDMTYLTQKSNYLSHSARELELAVHLAPQSPEALNQLGVTYRMLGRFQEAQQSFQKALDLDPKFAEALLNQGTVSLAKGNVGEAKDHFQQAIQQNSKNHMAHYRLGEALIQEGDLHKALQSLNTALSLDPGNGIILCKMAEAYDRQGNFPSASATYRKAILANPQFMPAYQGLANLYTNRGDEELAMAELKNAVVINPKFVRGYSQLGNLALSVDKTDQALKYFKEALAQSPGDSDALEGLSQTYMVMAQKSATASQGVGTDADLIQAQQSVEEALRVNPSDLRLHLAKLRLNQLAGNPVPSEQELNTILNQPAQNEAQRILQGEALFAVGRYQDSDQVFRSLIQASSREPKRLLLLADALKADKDLDLAKEAYSMASLAEPENPHAQLGVQRVEQAKADAEKSLRLAKALNTWTSRDKGSSIDYYEESLSKNPRQAEPRLALAKLYEKEKLYPKALKSYQLYLALSPALSENEKNKIVNKINKLQDRLDEEKINGSNSDPSASSSSSLPQANLQGLSPRRISIDKE